MGWRKLAKMIARQRVRPVLAPRSVTDRRMRGSMSQPARVQRSSGGNSRPRNNGYGVGREGLPMCDSRMRPLCAVGIGLRAPHLEEILATRPAIGWLELHAENYMGGGPALTALTRLRADYPLSIHGVGLSLGSADALDERHLYRLTRLLDRL